MPSITKPKILTTIRMPVGLSVGPEFDDIIAAANAGKQIQLNMLGGEWVDRASVSLTCARADYRVKPEILTVVKIDPNRPPGPGFEDIIAAAQDGKRIQFLTLLGRWVDKDEVQLICKREKYRVKPESESPLTPTIQTTVTGALLKSFGPLSDIHGPLAYASAAEAFFPQYPSPKVTTMPKITRHEAPVVTPPPTFTLNLSEAELAFIAGVTGRIAGPTGGVRGISDGLWKEAMHALGIKQTSGLLNAKEGGLGCLHIPTTVAELTDNLRVLQALAK